MTRAFPHSRSRHPCAPAAAENLLLEEGTTMYDRTVLGPALTTDPQAMMSQPARLYTLFAGVFLLLQGTSTLAARLYPPLDRAFPWLLGLTRMVPAHSLLHIGTALIALWITFKGGPRTPYWFALLFGAFYLGLAVVGHVTGHQLGLGLQPFDHPFHVVLGGLGLVAAAIESYRARSA
jgi:hypothetical protein